MELTLKEKFVVLAYHPKKGYNLSPTYFGYGIGGAILLELAAIKKIKIEDKKVVLIDTRRTGDEVLDKMMELLSASSRQLKVKSIVSKVHQKNKDFKHPVREGLVKKHYLKEVKKRFLILPYKRFPTTNYKHRKEMVDHIRRLVLRNVESESDIPLLAGLAGACQFSKTFFQNKEERKIAARRIKEIVKESQVDAAIDETVKAVQAAVMISVTTAASISAAH
jgi:hypothetical protein